MSRQYIKEERNGANREVLEKLTLGGLRRAVQDGDIKHGSVMMGQIAGLVHEVKSLSDIFEDLMQDSRTQFQALEKKMEAIQC